MKIYVVWYYAQDLWGGIQGAYDCPKKAQQAIDDYCAATPSLDPCAVPEVLIFDMNAPLKDD